ncbi:glucosaminidase domain-containing protein [Candidatus Daviesbacteria bacterium]|nr:glucosaminidase domain-containing protein [Candidatus Daviesbacteria bacterium]
MQTDNLKPYSLWLISSWFGASFTCLIFAILFSFYLSSPKLSNPINQNFKSYAALPETNSQVSEQIERTDARPKIIEGFFKKYHSPLSSFSELFVGVADKYDLNYRLLPAIAMQESNGGKRVIANSFNPFGFGIYGSSVIRFSSWEESIEMVGRALRENYLNMGLNTPQKIMTKYTPPSLAKGGRWAKGVSVFMEELR